MEERRWLELYREAVLEVDRTKLAERVKVASEAIQNHASSANGQLSVEERMAMEDAISSLRVLHRESESDFS
jgi:hypothetical protein